MAASCVLLNWYGAAESPGELVEVRVWLYQTLGEDGDPELLGDSQMMHSLLLQTRVLSSKPIDYF